MYIRQSSLRHTASTQNVLDGTGLNTELQLRPSRTGEEQAACGSHVTVCHLPASSESPPEKRQTAVR